MKVVHRSAPSWRRLLGAPTSRCASTEQPPRNSLIGATPHQRPFGASTREPAPPGPTPPGVLFGAHPGAWSTGAQLLTATPRGLRQAERSTGSPSPVSLLGASPPKAAHRGISPGGDSSEPLQRGASTGPSPRSTLFGTFSAAEVHLGEYVCGEELGRRARMPEGYPGGPQQTPFKTRSWERVGGWVKMWERRDCKTATGPGVDGERHEGQGRREAVPADQEGNPLEGGTP